MKIILDSNNIAYRAKFVNGALDDGVSFGFMMQILSFSKVLNSSDFIFCWDSRKSYRTLLRPEYKANRRQDLTEEEKKENADAFRQFTELRTSILPNLGFKNIFMKTGLEADDLIAYIVKTFPDEYIVVSSDQDLYQLFDYSKIYNPATKKILDKDWFIEKYGIESEEWVNVKALVGCSTDNVGGLVGIGEKTAIRYLNGELVKGKKLETINNSTELVEENLKVVQLPLTDDIDITLQPDELFELDFIDEFSDMGFGSFLSEKKMNTWVQRFNLQPGRPV